MPQRIALLALESCFASNIVGTLDLLYTANIVASRRDPTLPPPFEWQVLSLDGRRVRTSNGTMLSVDGGIDSAPVSKVVIVPAMSIAGPELLDERIEACRPVLPWLKAQHEQGAVIAGVCSASFLLAESGLLDGKPATTTWWLAGLFEKRYPSVALESTSMLTSAGRVICAGTGMAHLDLALHLIEIFGSRELARLCAKYVVVDHRRRSQAPYTVLYQRQGNDAIVLKAEKWIKANLRNPISIEDIAAHVAVSPRTLARRFKECTGDSPQTYVQKLRLEASKALLENTAMRLDEIIERVGYSDDAAFRRLFKKHTSLSPREYRKRFAVAGTGSVDDRTA